MSFLVPVLELFVAGSELRATAELAGAAITPDVVGELGRAAALVENPEFSLRLRWFSEELNQLLQAKDENGIQHLRTGLSQLFREMDADARSRLVGRLRGYVRGESVSQTLLEMMRRGNWRELGTFLSQQPAIVLREPVVLRSRFALALEQGDVEVAQRIVKEMESADPAHPAVWIGRAELALIREDTDEAQKITQEGERVAASHFPDDREIYDHLCSLEIRIHFARRDWDEANRRLQEWFKKGSEAALAERYFWRGRLCEQLFENDFHAATGWMEKAAALFPNRSDFLLGLAKSYFREGKESAASEVLKKIKSLDPLSPEIWQEIAGFSLELGDRLAAMDAFYKAASLLKPRTAALVPVGLGILLAYAWQDWERGTPFEIILREILRRQRGEEKDSPMVITLAMQNFYRAMEETDPKERKKFSEERLRFGSALFAYLYFVETFLGEVEMLRFGDRASRLGEEIFGREDFNAILGFLDNMRGLPSGAAPYLSGEVPNRWNDAVCSDVLAALQSLFRKADYLTGMRLVRGTLERFGLHINMNGSARATLERWLARFVFHWAFEGVEGGVAAVKEDEALYRRLTTDRGRLSYIEILVRQYDKNGFPRVGDRLLTLSDDSSWMHLLTLRYLQRSSEHGTFDDFILNLPQFRLALRRVQGERRRGSGNGGVN